MAVFRIEKTRDYTVMSNHHLRNTELSLKAKGLLSLMLSLPEGWDYTMKGLAHICKDGVDSISAGVRELEAHGYLIRERVRNANGQLGSIEYTILEQPRPPQPKQPEPIQEKPIRENPIQVDPTLEAPIQGNPAQLKERYGKSKQLRFLNGHPLIPIGYVQTRDAQHKKKTVNRYTPEGRAEIHKNLGVNTDTMIWLMRTPVLDKSIEFADNRISLFAAQYGRCAITGAELMPYDIRCHHKVPLENGGTDKYSNLVLVTEAVHLLIHATLEETIQKYLKQLQRTRNNLKSSTDCENWRERQLLHNHPLML